MPAAGRLIGANFNGTFTSCETSCSISFGRENLPATAVDSGGWREFINGLREWQVTVAGNLLLEAVGSDIKKMLVAGYFNDNPIYIQFATRPSSDIQLVFSGLALFTSGDITAPSTGAANWNVVLKGTGKLDYNLQEYSILIDAMPPSADYPTIVNEQVI